MAEKAGDWCLIESDPGIFSELIREFGKSRFPRFLLINLDKSCLFQLIFRMQRSASRGTVYFGQSDIRCVIVSVQLY